MKKKANMIYLRGHHLLCLQGYQGYGNDEEFKNNMEKILNELKKNSSCRNIILTESPDTLCKYCPNLKNDICVEKFNSIDKKTENEERIRKNNKKIVKMDSIVLKKSNLKKNACYSFHELIDIVNKAFPTITYAKKVCGNCKWIYKCLWYKSRKSK